MARAALRSLSGPSTSPTSNDAPFLPRPPQPSPCYAPAPGPSQPPYRQFAHAASRHSVHYDHHHHHHRRRHYDSTSFDDAHFGSTSTLAHADPLPIAAASNESSFFHDKSITASPESSPKMALTAPFLPPPPSHPHVRHSIPSTAPPSHLHEVALRRASLALGANLQDVRQIVTHALHPTHTSKPPWSHPSAAQHHSAFQRQVLDVYRIESERASQPYDSHSMHHSSSSLTTRPVNTDLASSTRSDLARSSDRASPSARFNPHADRSSLVNWGTRPDLPLPTFEPRLAEPSLPSASARLTDQATAWPTSATPQPELASIATSSIPRPASPSPFADDAFRRTSHPVTSSRSDLPNAPSIASRASFGSVDELARRHPDDQDPAYSRAMRQPYLSQPRTPNLPHNATYERRVRSIDDHLEQHPLSPSPSPSPLLSQSYQQHARHLAHSIHSNSATTDQPDDRLPDRSARSASRHSYQPYPPQNTRYAPTQSVMSTSAAPTQSPQLSPTMPEYHRFQPIPGVRSPAAETVLSVASSSIASVAALTPSPRLGATAPSSASFHPTDVDGHVRNSLRASSEDTVSEATRARVASMHIDDNADTRDASKPTLRKPPSLRSSFSHPDRRSLAIPGTDLSHSVIMQKLQDKVKSRLVAKGKAALIAENANNKSHKGIKAKKLTASISAAKAAKSDATGPSKRSASNLSKLHSPLQAPAQDATSQASQSNSPPRTTTTAKKSAATKSTTSVAGVPAAKVRRTSASSQQKPDLKPSPAASPNAPVTTRTSSRPPATIEQALSALSPKPSSPPPKENSTPTSIEAALLSPTDNPTPSQAAAQHAQRLFRSPLPPERAVETASGQALPADLPGAGQMNASSATKQQTSKSGVDSIIQASQSNEPTDQSSAIA